MHCGSKFYQNQETIDEMLRPAFGIIFKIDFLTTVMLWIANMYHHAKFHQNWLNICKDIVKVCIFHWFCTKTVLCAFFAVLG